MICNYHDVRASYTCSPVDDTKFVRLSVPRRGRRWPVYTTYKNRRTGGGLSCAVPKAFLERPEVQDRQNNERPTRAFDRFSRSTSVEYCRVACPRLPTRIKQKKIFTGILSSTALFFHSSRGFRRSFTVNIRYDTRCNNGISYFLYPYKLSNVY